MKQNNFKPRRRRINRRLWEMSKTHHVAYAKLERAYNEISASPFNVSKSLTN